MCWMTTFPLVESVAENPIKVYKVAWKNVGGETYSLFNHFNYKIGKRYGVHRLSPARVSSLLQHFDGYVIYSGFHSYSMDMTFIDIVEDDIRIKSHDALHTNLATSVIDGELGKCILICTIPEGSKYYINEYGEIVSDSIIVDEVLDISKDLKEQYEERGIRCPFLC